MKSNTFKLVNFLFLSRVILYILPWIAIIILLPDRNLPTFAQYLNSWSHWDAPHYFYIAQNGYTNSGDPANFIVFLPLFPVAIAALTLFIKNALLSSLLLSNLFFILGGVLFYKLVSIDFPEKISKRATIILALFPTAYFFSAPYPESLFLLLTVASFYFARRERWKLGGIFAGLATITRPFGILIAPSIIFEYLTSKKKNFIDFLSLIIPTGLGIGLYLLINFIIFKNPLEFQKILSENWSKHFALPTTGLLYAWKTAISSDISQYSITVGWAEALTTTIALILIPFAFKFLRRSMAVYYTLSVILFSSTSFILSSPRYLLSIPPFFILLSLITKRLSKIWQFISIGLLLILTISYTLGYWSF